MAAVDNFRRFYSRESFAALGSSEIDEIALHAHIEAEGLEVPIAIVHAHDSRGAAVEWGGDVPTEADKAKVDHAIATYAGGSLSRAPLEFLAWAPITALSQSLVEAVAFDTSPLEGGTYQVIGRASLRMLAVVAGQGAQLLFTLTRTGSPGNPPVTIVLEDAWGEAVKHAYAEPITFTVRDGEQINGSIALRKITSAGGTAEISNVRVTIDRMG